MPSWAMWTVASPPRALTRNVDSDKATELAKIGAEVVAADLDHEASLRKAFEGGYGAFCVTNFWEHFSPEKELAQATNMAHAAKHTGLQHVIWSTLEDTAPVNLIYFGMGPKKGPGRQVGDNIDYGRQEAPGHRS